MGTSLSNNSAQSITSDDIYYPEDTDFSYEEQLASDLYVPAEAPRHLVAIEGGKGKAVAQDDEAGTEAAPQTPVKKNFFGKVPDLMKIPEASTQDLTSLGIASRLVIHFEGKIAYRTTTGGKGSWFWYTGKFWAPDPTGSKVDQCIRTVLISMRDDEPAYAVLNSAKVLQAQENLDKLRRFPHTPAEESKFMTQVEMAKREAAGEVVSYAAKAADASNIVNGARKAAMHLLEVPDYMFDKDTEELLNCQNGTVDMRTKELRKFDPKDYITKITAGSYDPANLLNEHFRFILDYWNRTDAGFERFIQRFIGMGFTGYATARRMLYIDGASGAMKSTLLKAAVYALGDVNGNGYGRTPDLPLFLAGPSTTGNEVSPALHALRGCRLCFVDEANKENAKINGPMAKKLASGEGVNSRTHQGDSVTWNSEMALVFAGNGRLNIPNDDGVKERLLVMKLEHAVPVEDRNPDGEAVVLNSQEGHDIMLAFGVEGAYQFIKNGRTEPALEVTESMKIERVSYIADSDPIGDWWEDEIEVVDPKALDYVPLTTNELHEYYQDFMKRHKLIPMGKANTDGLKAFGRMLDDRGFPQRDTTKKVEDAFGNKHFRKAKMRLGLKHSRQSVAGFVEHKDNYIFTGRPPVG